MQYAHRAFALGEDGSYYIGFNNDGTGVVNMQGKVVLITGATRGIGRKVVHGIAPFGATMIVVGRDQSRIDEVISEAKAIDGCGPISGEVCNLLEQDEIRALAERIKSQHSQLDVLVNNAGSNIPEHFTKVQKKNMEQLVKLNTMATFNLAQLCTIKMLESKNRKKIGGSIINMSSQMGHVGGPIRSVYNMTKFGLEGLTKGMAIDLAKNNIRVNTVCPTFVDTPMTKDFFKNKKFKVEVLKKIPLGRIAEVSDVATAVAFLASDASSMITGTSLLVDGGWTAI